MTTVDDARAWLLLRMAERFGPFHEGDQLRRDLDALIAAVRAEWLDEALRRDAAAYIEAMHQLNAALRIGGRTPDRALDTLDRLADVPARLAKDAER